MMELTNKLKIDSNGSQFLITASSFLEEVKGFGRALKMFRFALHVCEEREDGNLVREMDGMELN